MSETYDLYTEDKLIALPADIAADLYLQRLYKPAAVPHHLRTRLEALFRYIGPRDYESAFTHVIISEQTGFNRTLLPIDKVCGLYTDNKRLRLTFTDAPFVNLSEEEKDEYCKSVRERFLRELQLNTYDPEKLNSVLEYCFVIEGLNKKWVQDKPLAPRAVSISLSSLPSLKGLTGKDKISFEISPATCQARCSNVVTEEQRAKAVSNATQDALDQIRAIKLPVLNDFQLKDEGQTSDLHDLSWERKKMLISMFLSASYTTSQYCPDERVVADVHYCARDDDMSGTRVCTLVSSVVKLFNEVVTENKDELDIVELLGYFAHDPQYLCHNNTTTKQYIVSLIPKEAKNAKSLPEVDQTA